ncbi:MAG: hypothetical protein JSW51_10335 [Gemmatimonadota bacterium]|nr:MAG: hypothetical protein JSW51_10335 [Gemmatimonadota bacterium]
MTRFPRLTGRTAHSGSVLYSVLLIHTFGACTFLGTSAPDEAGPKPGDIKVLFIGSSYLDYNDMPAMVERFAIKADRDIYVGRRILPGHRLDYFASDPVTEQRVNEHDWDYVVLQGGCMNAAYPETHHELQPNQGYHPVYPALATLKGKIDARGSKTRTVYMMGWAFEDGLTWIAGQTDTYDEMQEHVYDNSLLWSDSLDLVVAPVGWAWRELLADDPPQHYLHDTDWNHANPRGTYLSAAVIYATLFGESVEGLDYNGGLVASEAEELRRVASRVVMDNLQLWNVEPQPTVMLELRR